MLLNKYVSSMHARDDEHTQEHMQSAPSSSEWIAASATVHLCYRQLTNECVHLELLELEELVAHIRNESSNLRSQDEYAKWRSGPRQNVHIEGRIILGKPKCGWCHETSRHLHKTRRHAG
jgi:hypothetical protein